LQTAERPPILLWTLQEIDRMPEPANAFTPPSSPPVNPSPAVPVHVDRLPPGAVQSDPPQSLPQARWQAMQQRITAERPWSNPDLVFTKDASGVITSRPRDGAANGTQPEGQQQPGQQQQPQRGPASVDGGKLKIGDFELSPSDVQGLLERASLEKSRAANLPTGPENYSLDLPSDLVLPEGTSWQWDTDNPVNAATLDAARRFAHENGIDQAGFSKLLGIYANGQLAEQAHFNRARQQQIEALGPAAPARVDAVTTFLESQLGSQLSRALTGVMFTADSVRAVERLMRNYVSQGVGGNPAGARDGAHGREPARLSDEAYAKLSYFEKQQYAAQFPQR
jgi:hypothetical protein